MKKLYKSMMAIGTLPCVLTLVVSVVSMFVGYSDMPNEAVAYGWTAFSEFFILSVTVFWPLYIMGVAVIALALFLLNYDT